MVPRNEVQGVEIDTTVDALTAAFAGAGFSKLVVFQGDMDYIVGYVHAKDLFDLPGSLEILLPTFVVLKPWPATSCCVNSKASEASGRGGGRVRARRAS